MVKYFITLLLFFLTLVHLFSDDLLIRLITFEGNHSFTSRELQGIILSRENSPVNRSIVNDDAQRIYNFYLQNGKNLFKVHTPNIVPVSNSYVDVIFLIEEFSEPVIERIIFQGNSYFSDSKIFELIERLPDEKHDLLSLDFFIKQIIELYLSRGFLFVKVQLSSVIYDLPPPRSMSGGGMGGDNHYPLSIIHYPLYTATISITEGPFVRAENFIFRGNDVTKENILIAESRIQRGEIITPEIINTAERRLSSKPYIQSCQILPVNENTLLINIIESNMTHISAVMGYSTSEDGKNSFNGFIDGEFLNLMGTDRNFSFGWRGFDGIFTSFRLEYHESGPVNIPIAGDLRFYREERDSTSVKTEIGADVYLSFKTQKFGILGAFNELFPGSRRPMLLEKQTDRVIGFFWEGDFVDDFINPREGWYMKYTQQYLFVHREDERLQRHRFEAKISNFYPISRSWVLANSLTGMYLENESLTEYDLIRVGGAFSIRGFHEDFFAGNTIIYTNTEFRYLMSRYSRVFLFLDYGYIEDNRPTVQNRLNDLIGLGLGLRVETRLGLLRIDYGFHHASGEWLNPLNGIIHFGIEASF